MKLTVEISRRSAILVIIALLAGVGIWGIASQAIGVYRQNKAAKEQASYAACETKKDQYLFTHRFDSLIKEQEWITEHPEDPRLKGAPRGSQLEEELIGEYKGPNADLKENEPPTAELTAFTGHQDEPVLNESSDSDYYLTPENEALLQALKHVFGEKSDLAAKAKSLGYSYTSNPEEARRNVIRAIRFANIFSPYSSVLFSYAHRGEDPSLREYVSYPFFCAAR